ncbi:MAG: ParA family protein [Cyclobacteriaceae bacterium]
MIIKTIIQHKGGVGKTTTTLNLGKGLSMEGYKVLIIDTDPQANLSQCVGIENPEANIYDTYQHGTPLPIVEIDYNFHLVPSSLDLVGAESTLLSRQIEGYVALKNALEPVQENYDYILIDCPPTLGILTTNALLASTDALIVLQSHYLALRGMETIMGAIKSVKKFNPGIKVSGILITQTERTVANKKIIEVIRDSYGELVYETMIRKNISVMESSIVKQDIFTYDPTCAAAEDYLAFTKELIQKEK